MCGAAVASVSPQCLALFLDARSFRTPGRPRRSGSAQARVQRAGNPCGPCGFACLVEDGRPIMLGDTGLRATAEGISAVVAHLGGWLAQILLTHDHDNHRDAAEAARRATVPPVAAHRLDADRIRQGGPIPLRAARLLLQPFGPLMKRVAAAGLWCDALLRDDENPAALGGRGRGVWTPGRTPRSMTVVLPNGDVLVGEALASGNRQRPRQLMFVDDARAAANSIRSAERSATDDVRVARRSRVDHARLAGVPRR